ncbi:hypothetical protein M422DRAFT_255404 [Sphaerobolus stellatus SS14]|uniref:Uncharacterized protein n=1 Tax=Sphaerobolus stellatus (strain SS14) TaxID=990650 RepID=A0A0C9VIY3_SPHS4|nr:hypothetical protein M422DRAFT_255404 [Sphaerobolus stellatus SS14]
MSRLPASTPARITRSFLNKEEAEHALQDVKLSVPIAVFSKDSLTLATRTQPSKKASASDKVPPPPPPPPAAIPPKKRPLPPPPTSTVHSVKKTDSAPSIAKSRHAYSFVSYTELEALASRLGRQETLLSNLSKEKRASRKVVLGMMNGDYEEQRAGLERLKRFQDGNYDEEDDDSEGPSSPKKTRFRDAAFTTTTLKFARSDQITFLKPHISLDIKALYSITTQDQQLKHLVQEYEKFLTERLSVCSAKVGYHVETSCTVLDLNNDYYPENTWPWLDEITVSNIDILGRDYKKRLLEQISAENLPKVLGGLCECEGSCSTTDAGPWHNMSKDEVEAGLKKIRNNEFPSSPVVPNVPKEAIIGQKA